MGRDSLSDLTSGLGPPAPLAIISARGCNYTIDIKCGHLWVKVSPVGVVFSQMVTPGLSNS